MQGDASPTSRQPTKLLAAGILSMRCATTSFNGKASSAPHSAPRPAASAYLYSFARLGTCLNAHRRAARQTPALSEFVLLLWKLTIATSFSGNASSAPRRAPRTCVVAMTAPTVALTQKKVNMTRRRDLHRQQNGSKLWHYAGIMHGYVGEFGGSQDEKRILTSREPLPRCAGSR